MPHVDLSDYDWVFARYPASPDPQVGGPKIPEGCREDWKKWQYSSTGEGSLFGCESTYVDLDVFHGTVEDLEDFLGLEEADPVRTLTELELALKEIAELKTRASKVLSALVEMAELL